MNAFFTKLAIVSLGAVSISAAGTTGKDIYSITVKDIDGKQVSMSDYRGKVVLIVNTASLCGYTPQYTGLETLYKTYKDKGFEILAFPSNDFGAQEPGNSTEIKEFCSINYKTSFKLFEKIAVSGPRPHPLYTWLTASEGNVRFAGPISWNFNKFLIDGEGKIVARFDSPVEPMAAQVTQAVEKALKQGR